MNSRSRRSFLKAATLAPGLALAAGASETLLGQAPDQAAQEEADSAVLAAVAALVLPTRALGVEGIARAIELFGRWADHFEPVAELDHPYLSSDEIGYGPPDPRPLWVAQLRALEIESQKRHGRSFAELGSTEQEEILRRQLPSDLETELPSPAEAPHVAIAMMAWFFGTPQANDLCYGAAIGRYSCRGLPSAVERPAPLDQGSAGGAVARTWKSEPEPAA